MRKVKANSRVASLLLALLMVIGAVFATGIPAKAATGTLKIHKLSQQSCATEDKEEGKSYYEKETGVWHEYLMGAQYTVYEIGTMTQTTGADGQIQVVYTPTLSGLTSISEETDADAIVIPDGTSPAAQGTTAAANGGVLEFTLTTEKVYLVKETVTPEGVSKANNFIITVPMYLDGEWKNDIEAFPKNMDNDTSITKSSDIPGNSDDGNKKSVNVGEVVDYEVKVTVPTDILTANYTKFNIVDTSSSSLTIDLTTVDVKLGATTLTLGTGYTRTYSGNVLTISFYNDAGTALTSFMPGDEITLTYKAKIGQSAGTAINNRAEVVYTTDSGEKVVPPGPGGTEDIYTYSYGVQKVDDETASALEGAKFILSAYFNGANEQVPYAASGVTQKWLAYTDDAWSYVDDADEAKVFTSAADGMFKAEGLKYGIYYMTEIEAPAGYTLLRDDIEVTIGEVSTEDAYDAGFTIQVVNKKSVGGGLPDTGGKGIYLYIFLGVGLIAAAAVVYVKTRKKSPAV